MTRLLRYVLLVILTILLLTVALANRGLITLHLLPQDMAALFQVSAVIDLPVFVVLFVGVLIGIVVGFVIEWLREHKHRRTATTKSRQVTQLERELATLKDQTALPDDDVLALLEKPKAR